MSSLQNLYQDVHLYYLEMNMPNNVWQNENMAFEVMLLNEEFPNLIQGLQGGLLGTSSIIKLEKRLKTILYLCVLSDKCFGTEYMVEMKRELFENKSFFETANFGINLDNRHSLIKKYILNLTIGQGVKVETCEIG